MNTNAIHNILNWAIAGIAVLSVPEVVALLSPEFAIKLAGSLAVLKSVINVLRDGLGGLFANQPPVQ
jgi:hypothetical protein